MNQKTPEIQRDSEAGYLLIAVVVLLFLATLGAMGMLALSRSSVKTASITKQRAEEYYQGERTVAHVVSWMRQNSQKLIWPFRKDNFYSSFENTAHDAGDNDDSIFTLPTQLKLNGTSDSALVASDGSLGTSVFPFTRDITTYETFDVPAEFSTADFGWSLTRLTLLTAVPDNPAKDHGPPPAPAPETDFSPVFRIDAVSEVDSGAHIYATVVGDLAHVFDMGIYGQDYLEINQPCDSYISADGAYGAGTRRANCPAGSNSEAAVHKNEEIYGSLQTNGWIDPDPPYGGDTCADFQPNCPNPGETCAGEDCGVPLLEVFDQWDNYCNPALEQPLRTIVGTVAAPEVVTPASAAPGDSCWEQIDIGPNKAMVLDSTTIPYFIEVLNLDNNGQLLIQPDVPDGTVELYVREIVGDKFNGGQAINMGGRPTNFYLYYLGTNPLVLNGNADMNVALVAPNAPVTVSGNFDYHGALLAKELTLSGSGGIHYDESLGGGGPVSDIQFEVKEIVQRYR